MKKKENCITTAEPDGFCGGLTSLPWPTLPWTSGGLVWRRTCASDTSYFCFAMSSKRHPFFSLLARWHRCIPAAFSCPLQSLFFNYPVPRALLDLQSVKLYDHFVGTATFSSAVHSLILLAWPYPKVGPGLSHQVWDGLSLLPSGTQGHPVSWCAVGWHLGTLTWHCYPLGLERVVWNI